jgi:glycine/D-amino acid oxidase-like deaminating enzyme
LCLHALAGAGHPVKATRALADAAQSEGAHILTGQEVIGINQSGDDVYRVETRQGEFGAEKLVIAAGAWCGPMGELLGLRIPIVPVRGQMWATEAFPPSIFHTISSTESSLHRHRDTGNDADTPTELTHKGSGRVTRHLYGRQTRDGEIIFGGDRQMVGYHQAPDATGIEVNRGHATEVFPLLRRIPVKRTWAGLMPFSLDETPSLAKYRSGTTCISSAVSAPLGSGAAPWLASCWLITFTAGIEFLNWPRLTRLAA